MVWLHNVDVHCNEVQQLTTGKFQLAPFSCLGLDIRLLCTCFERTAAAAFDLTIQFNPMAAAKG